MMQTDLTSQIRNIDLAEIVRGAGTQLRPAGGQRLVGLCPFHDEKSPSFFVFPDARYHCFSCGEHGNAVDFIQKLHGCGFKQALKIIGIRQGKLSADDRKAIRDARRRRAEAAAYRIREIELSYTLGYLIRASHEKLKAINPGTLEHFAEVLDQLPWWEYCHDIFIFGDELQKRQLCDSLAGMPVIDRGIDFAGCGYGR